MLHEKGWGSNLKLGLGLGFRLDSKIKVQAVERMSCRLIYNGFKLHEVNWLQLANQLYPRPYKPLCPAKNWKQHFGYDNKSPNTQQTKPPTNIIM
jgi:hypothetical protein